MFELATSFKNTVFHTYRFMLIIPHTFDSSVLNMHLKSVWAQCRELTVLTNIRFLNGDVLRWLHIESYEMLVVLT